MMMSNNHKCVALCALLAVLPVVVEAVTFVNQPDVFTPDILPAPTAPATYYGELTDWPHTFTFSVSRETTVAYTLATARDADPVSLLLVREAQRGVEEVVRQNSAAIDWYPVRDTRLGLALNEAPTVVATLTPGSYKLEISNPVNQGKYQLQIGEGSQSGFFGTIGDTFRVHHFYGHWVTALGTWRVLLLVGLVLCALGYGWRRYRR
jgi:hypothetical protein